MLLGIFFLAYSAIRHQGIGDTAREIKEIFQEKVESNFANDGAYK